MNMEVWHICHMETKKWNSVTSKNVLIFILSPTHIYRYRILCHCNRWSTDNV